ncbi:MAG: VOC family protein [Spirochaetales bacterium]|nr:VOC family protein [Spirochaetales bacterium]
MKITKAAVDLSIIVRDIDKALKFYRDVLGFPVNRVDTVPQDLGKRLLFSTTGCRIHRLYAGDTEIKLIEFDNPPESDLCPIESRSGIRYFTLSIADFLETYIDLQFRGVKFLSEPVQAKDGRFLIFLQDPDGNYIELEGR